MNYKQKTDEINEMLSDKTARYQDSFEKVDKMLKLLYPSGVGLEQYKDVILISSVLVTLTKIAGNENRWKDIAGYGVLGMNDDI